MLNKIGIICLLFLFVGCTKEIIKEVPVEVNIYPTLKVADCGNNLVISLNDTTTEMWNSEEYSDWKAKYNLSQFFYHPFECLPNRNGSCSYYRVALITYNNCSVYYIDTEKLYG